MCNYPQILGHFSLFFPEKYVRYYVRILFICILYDMGIYVCRSASESNYENTDFFYPDEADKDVAVQKVEAGFLDFLKNDFFEQDGASYWILEENGVWISALRLSRIQTDLYYLEALETWPEKCSIFSVFCELEVYVNFYPSGELPSNSGKCYHSNMNN